MVGLDIKSFDEFEKSQNKLIEQEQNHRHKRPTTSNTIVTLLGLTLIGGPIFLMILEKLATWLRPRNNHFESAWNSNDRYNSRPLNEDRNGDIFPIKARALYDYHSPYDGDLSFRKGDIILILQKPYEQWWEGALADNPREVGLFPANYVEEIRDPRF